MDADKIVEWLSQYWFWLLLVGGFIAMHLFGHRGHGGHNERGGGQGEPFLEDSDTPKRKSRHWH